MPSNIAPLPELLQEIANLKRALTETACRQRAERMDRQQSKEGRAAIVERLRKSRPMPIR